MSDLKKLKLQQEATAIKIEQQIKKDAAILSEDLHDIAKESGRDLKNIISIMETAIALAEVTKKSIYDLLELDEPIDVVSKNKPDSDKKYRDWLKSSVDETHKIGGKDMVITDKTRLTQNVRDYVDSLKA